MLEADERALPQPAAHSGSMLVAGAASGLAALALVASRHRSQQRARVARGPGRIIDALFGKGTLDKMLGSFTPPSSTLTAGKSPAATPKSPPPGGEDPEDGEKLEKSLQRQEKQTVAIENMMGELQTLMMSKVDEERRINSELRQDMDDLRAQIGVVQDSYANACDQLEMTTMELDSRTARVSSDLTQERDTADQRTVDAAKRQKELESEVEKMEAERKRIYDQRDVIVGEIKNLGNTVVQRSTERDEMKEAKAQAEAQKADLEDQVAATEADKASLADQIAASSAESAELEAQAEAAAGQTALLLDQRKVITGEVANLTTKVVNLDSQKAQLNSEIAQLNSENDEFGVKVESLEGDKASLEGKIGVQKATAGNLENKKAGIEDEIALLMEQRKLIAKEVASITQKVVTNESEKAALREQIAASEAQEAQLNESIHGLEGTKVGLEQELKDSQSTVADYESEIKNVSGQITNLKTQRKVVVGEVAKLTEKVVEASQYKDDLLGQVASRDTSLSLLEERISTVESQNTGLQNKISAGRVEHAELLKKQTAAEQSVEQGKQMRTMIAKEVGRLTDKVSEANFKKGDLEEAIFIKEGEKVDLEGQVANLEGETGYLSQNVADMTDERDRLVKRVLHMNAENKKLEECVVLGTEEKEMLAVKLAEAVSKQKELDSKLQLRQERFEMQLRAGSGPPPALQGELGPAMTAEVNEVEAQLRGELLSASQENQRLMGELRDMIGKLDELQMLQPV
jgi:chromosome segregation ATPase